MDNFSIIFDNLHQLVHVDVTFSEEWRRQSISFLLIVPIQINSLSLALNPQQYPPYMLFFFINLQGNW